MLKFFMRILFLSKRQYMGKDLLDDAYGRFYEIPLELAKLGHQITGLAFSYRNRSEGHIEVGPDTDSRLVKWFSVNLGLLIIPGWTRYKRKINNLIEISRPDVIIACSDALHAIIGITMAKKFNIPCVIDLYDNFESYNLTKIPIITSRFHQAIDSADGISCVSEKLKDFVMTNYKPKGIIKVIENGIPLNLFHKKNQKDCRKKLGLPQDAKIIGTAGALVASRGIDILFKAFNELNNQDTSIHIALAGQVEPGTKLPQGPQVHYFGNMKYEDIPILLNSLDVGIVCNLDSPFGRYCFPQKIYEMIACCIPIVAANIGVAQKLFRKTPDCLYTPDNYQDFMRALTNQLQNPVEPKILVSTWPELAIKMDMLLNEVTCN